MSVLTEELEFIWNWLEDINPDPERYDFRSYEPGLSRDQITNLTQSLPFNFPEELYQLYEWTNGRSYEDNKRSYIYQSGHIYIKKPPSLGDSLLFKDNLNGGGMEFFPLDFVVKDYREKMSRFRARPNEEHEEESWLLIAAIEWSELYVDCSTTPPQVHHCNTDDGPRIERTYKSLTAMFSVIAECCEMNLYQLVPDEYRGEVNLEIEIDKTKRELEREIFQKYNGDKQLTKPEKGK